MRFCYLCNRKRTMNEKITLHKFPKIPHIRQKWIKACGLNERDDVSHIYICSRHFKLPENLIALKRLPPGTVPTIEVPVQNHLVELRNVSTNTESITNTLKPVVNFTTPTVSNVMDYNNTIQSISEASTYSYSEENFSPPLKKRLFANPRYISEINISDFSTPKKARRLISFIKEVDQKKCKQIRCLQDQNRKFLKQIATLQKLVSHLKKLISEDAPDDVTQKLNILKKIKCPVVNDKMETSDKQILIFDHDYVKTIKRKN